MDYFIILWTILVDKIILKQETIMSLTLLSFSYSNTNV